MKIRGTAHHIGEKYLQLARDAQSSGDPVMAESYLQHAEHYFRIIATAQQAQQQAQAGYQRQTGDIDEDDGEDDDFANLPDRFASPSERNTQPQPVFPQPYPAGADRQPYEGRAERSYPNGGGQNGERQFDNRNNRNERQHGPDRAYGERQDRTYQDRSFGDRQGQDRGTHDRPPQWQDRQAQDRPTQDRPAQDRPAYNHQGGTDRQGADRQPQERSGEQRQGRDFDNRGRNRRDREFRDNAQPRDNNQARETRQPFVEDAAPGLPAFITTPTRPVPETTQPPEGVAPDVSATIDIPAVPQDGGDDVGFAMRPRRRRRPKPEYAGNGETDAAERGGGDPAGD